MTGRPQAIYAGYLVRCPLAGYVWQTAHYLRGLHDAGVDVWFYEDTRHSAIAYDPITRSSGTEYDNGLRIAADVMALAGLANRWVFYDALRDRWGGAGREAAAALFADARLLINAGGVHRFSAEERRDKTSVYIDMDPAYTQLRVAGGDCVLAEIIAEHQLHFTFGENIGTERSPIPTSGTTWRPTRQPVVLDFWEPTLPPSDGPFTTIGTWVSPERDVSFRGERYSWSKRDEWNAIMDLPRASGQRFSVAMEVADAAERAALQAAAWELLDPIEISADREAYQKFLRRSVGEFTTAKDVNVRLRSGWFSDRSACYLASGRPVITQDTAFGDVLPIGRGLFAYRTRQEAADAVEAVSAAPEEHGLAARRIAEDHFSAPQVIGRLLSAI